MPQEVGGEPTIGDLDDFQESPEDEGDVSADGMHGAGYTPWDYVELSEEQIKHEVGLVLQAGFQGFNNRLRRGSTPWSCRRSRSSTSGPQGFGRSEAGWLVGRRGNGAMALTG